MSHDDLAEKVQNLWKDPKFSGSYAGISTLQAALEHEKGIKISRRKLFEIMRENSGYILETRQYRKRFVRRPLRVYGYGALWQSDVAILFPQQGFMGFLLCVDCYCNKIFCRKLKTKSASEIKQKFIEIFKEANIKPEVLETDKVLN